MKKSLLLASASVALLTAHAAFAQDATQPTGDAAASTAAEAAVASDAAAPEAGAEEIIVTATRRATALSDVPIAVSAVSAETMQNSGASDIRQLNQLAPSLLVSSTGSESNGSARVRGIGTVGDNPGLESSVAVFVDGVYRSRSGIGLNELGEIERVEVLRGPQGTLFGRNASAGLINIISKKPSYESEGAAEFTYGNYDHIRAAGSLTGPIGKSETLAMRIDGVYVKRDGFYTDVVSGDDANDRDRLFVRGQLLFEPNDDLEVRIIGDYTTRDESCCGAAIINITESSDTTPTVPGDATIAASNRIVSVLQSLGGIINTDTYSRDIAVSPGRSFQNKTEDYGLSVQADYDMSFGTLTSITGYREYKSGGAADLDYGNVDLLFREDSYRKFKTFSQELRLQGSAFDDKLDWLFGAYYAAEDLTVFDDTTFGSQYGAFAACRIVATINPAAALRNPANPGCLSPAGAATLFTPAGPFGALAPAFVAGLNRLSTVNGVGDVAGSTYNQDSKNWALFTHNIFNVTDRLSVTLGVRYTDESKDFDASLSNNNLACPAQQAQLGPIANSLTAPAQATARALLLGIINLTCQGNSSSAINGLQLSDSRDESEWTGTGVISYKFTDDLMGYGSYSKGYKAGGFNLDRSALRLPFSAPVASDVANLQFSPEKVDAFEIGAKYAGGSFNINVAGFYQEFENFQLNTFNGSVFLVQNVNACGTDLNGADRDASGTTGACAPGDVKPGLVSKGVEIEASMFPADYLAVTAGYTYARTKFRNNLVGNQTGAPLDPALFLLPGDNLSNAPEHVVTASLSYTPPIGGNGLSALFYLDTRLASDYNTGSDLFPEKEQDGFALVNGRIGIRGPDKRWALEFWGQNLFNVNYQQVAFNAPYQGSNSIAQVRQLGAANGFGTANQIFSSYLAEPRTYGVTVRTKF
ncbi:TonB-dependent receptor [Sphingoaurantiacus capsulatus]|uniref:TonB-dependent receptor n=1 Tax=Sphingoaurantiacus capsulatus TaxID=1771310 RepID=A0ABV7XDJ1_9SPHN